MKDLLKKMLGQSLGRALLELRNSPRVADGLSPAQWFLGCRQRTLLPAPKSQYLRLSNETLATHMNKRLLDAEKVKELGPGKAEQKFMVGDQVVLQHPISKEWDHS